jgi:7,8-dihydropterin-6-yl-methyl-4-(beta-D-ribofuranosyl)aminobenzene 5'-phosphate synthase
MDMRISVLTDNIEYKDFKAEWGLSVLIEYEGRKILLDTGETGLFAENAAKMGLDLSEVDCSVLSHAHSDHANGFDVFFGLNRKAPLYVRASTAENCYKPAEESGEMEYIGIRKGYLETYRDRIHFTEGDLELMPGVWLLPHDTPGLEKMGRRAGLYIRKGNAYVPDSFQHEQSLVFDTPKGLVIFNSCSHAGADNIVREVSGRFPGRKLYAMIGGFHLFVLSDEEVRGFAQRLRETGVEHVITGHCTGDEAIPILREELGERLMQMHSGMVCEL